MPTQLNGRTANMDALCKIADNHGLLIIEDSAQALGSKFKEKLLSKSHHDFKELEEA